MGWRWAAVAAAAICTAAAQVPTGAPAPPSVREVRAGLVGAWKGELAYRDYQTDRWVGLPVTVTVELVPDGLTLIRRAVFDDGPRVGAVHITMVAVLDPETGAESTASFRAGRPVEPDVATPRLTRAADATHWTMIEERVGRDDDRPARIRETTTRDGVRLVTLKEVDFTDDAGEAWLQRNRTTLTRK
ncbi:hypothetical protein [uncultured Sphingomonas sp.]|uniref:hypothetical protein n=1 Tax=uncultured Sphingomonas sp. TaxID=158754 RepID=UPI0035CBEA95